MSPDAPVKISHLATLQTTQANGDGETGTFYTHLKTHNLPAFYGSDTDVARWIRRLNPHLEQDSVR